MSSDGLRLPLPGREAVAVRLAAATGPVALLIVDVDDFRDVTAAFGHAAGEQLVHALGPRLRAAARPQDLVARIGADAFAVVGEGLAGPWEALEVARRLAAAWSEPLELAGEELFVSASTGIAIGDPPAEELLRRADAALRRAKERGAGEVELYDDVTRERAHARLRLASDLRRALADEAIEVAYQPIVDLRTGRPCGVEALARWTHPERGPVSPSVFVPVAERTGVVAVLGRHVLRTACRQLAAWRAEVPGAGDLWVSVNVSARQVAGGELPGDVKDALRAADLPPQALALEVIESALMEETDGPGPVLALLRGLGVRVMLDDFGTGYSSLSYLRRLPVDGIKLDRSFIDGVAHPDASAVVEAMISLSTKLGLLVTAEGVETRAHAERLRVLGCALGQGYMLGRPLGPADMGSLLAERLAAPVALPEP